MITQRVHLSWLNRLPIAMMSMVLLLSASFSLQSLAYSDNPDVLHLATGQTTRGKIKAVTGDVIDYKDDHGRQHRLKRMDLQSRNDRIRCRDHVFGDYRTVEGELFFLRKTRIEIKQVMGMVKVRPVFCSSITLGL